MSPFDKSYALQTAAAKLGFDWPDSQAVIAKLQEEIQELRQAIKQKHNLAAIKDELGDILFCCINLARHLNIKPEQALQQANQKFKLRFAKIEALLSKQGKSFKQLDMDEMLTIWKQAKAELAKTKSM